MKKVLLLAALLISASVIYAQKKYETLSQLKIGDVKFEYQKIIDVDKKDTTTSVTIAFQNKEYTQIRDLKVIVFILRNGTDVLNAFVNDFKSAFSQLGSESSQIWDKEKYVLFLPKKDKEIWLYEPSKKGKGYTYFNKKQIEKVIEWFTSNGFTG